MKITYNSMVDKAEEYLNKHFSEEFIEFLYSTRKSAIKFCGENIAVRDWWFAEILHPDFQEEIKSQINKVADLNWLASGLTYKGNDYNGIESFYNRVVNQLLDNYFLGI